jgi:hypothetical protein
MTNRREFLQIGLLACTSSSLPLGCLADAGPAAGLAIPVQAVLQDLRYPTAANHAGGLLEQLASAGLSAPGTYAIKGLDGELMRFWFQARQRGVSLSLAGTTGADVLFCLEQLGRDAGLRVQWRSNHGKHADGSGEQTLYSWILAGSPASIAHNQYQAAEFA